MKLKKLYFEDIKLFKTTSGMVWSMAFIVLLLLLPFFIKTYYLSIINLMALNVIVALGLNILVGNTGQISLGHGGFVAIGAYTATFLLQLGVPFLITLLIAGIVAAIIGALLGIPSLRLEGPYLAIATLGFGLAVMVIIGRMDVFGGRMGMSVPKLNLSWTGLKYDESLYYVFILVTIVMTVFAHNIIKSRIGRAFQAVRDSDIAASVIGINLAKYKTLKLCHKCILCRYCRMSLGIISPICQSRHFLFHDVSIVFSHGGIGWARKCNRLYIGRNCYDLLKPPGG